MHLSSLLLHHIYPLGLGDYCSVEEMTATVVELNIL